MTQTTISMHQMDVNHLWHPYTDITAYEKNPALCFERGEGTYLYASDGRAFLDGIASWWCVALGHSHPKIVRAIQEQAEILQQSILGNLTHPKAVELAGKLAEITPVGLNHSYFASDGASATEAALKMAIQYWHNIGQQGKVKFVSLKEGYHGDTLGAVGVGYVPTFHHFFEGAICRSFTADIPHRPGNPDPELDHAFAMQAFESMQQIVEEHHHELAGVILEPLCQGAAGIRIYPNSYLQKVRALCNSYDLLLIADEIAVGFGRTGDLFACETAGIVPDILCVGKGLTGGYLPMSATIASDKVYDAFRNGPGEDRTFYDGHTYCGNPITSAAAIAAIDIFTSESIVDNVIPASTILAEGFKSIAEHKSVAYYKTLGLIGMCAFTEESGGNEFAKQVTQCAIDAGLFIRPLGEVLYLWPPLTASSDELTKMIQLFHQAIHTASK